MRSINPATGQRSIVPSSQFSSSNGRLSQSDRTPTIVRDHRGEFVTAMSLFRKLRLRMMGLELGKIDVSSSEFRFSLSPNAKEVSPTIAHHLGGRRIIMIKARGGLIV